MLIEDVSGKRSMSTFITPTSVRPSPPAAPPAVPEKVHLPITISDSIHVPGWVVDLESFRRWATSDECPERGRFAFLNGTLWMDPEMERLFSHNKVKSQYTVVLEPLTRIQRLGYYLTDGMLLTHLECKLSTEPDG